MGQIQHLPQRTGFRLLGTICLTLLDLLSISLWGITETENEALVLSGPNATDHRLFTLPETGHVYTVKQTERLHRAYHSQWGIKLVIAILNMTSEKPISYNHFFENQNPLLSIPPAADLLTWIKPEFLALNKKIFIHFPWSYGAKCPHGHYYTATFSHPPELLHPIIKENFPNFDLSRPKSPWNKCITMVESVGPENIAKLVDSQDPLHFLMFFITSLNLFSN